MRVEGSPREVAAAVRDPTDPRVPSPAPGPAHEHVGCVVADLSLDRRGALAAAARSLGYGAPQDDDIRAVREELAGVEVPGVDLPAARERVAAAAEERDELRERVARLQGKVRGLREAGDPTDAEAALEEATRELSAVETEHAAAEQALAHVRERAREARDVRERRLRLRDRVGNLERDAREHLAGEVRPRADEAVAVADWTDARRLAEATDPTAALAVARVADLAAPVVLGDVPDPGEVWLDAPVLRVYDR